MIPGYDSSLVGIGRRPVLGATRLHPAPILAISVRGIERSRGTVHGRCTTLRAFLTQRIHRTVMRVPPLRTDPDIGFHGPFLPWLFRFRFPLAVEACGATDPVDDFLCPSRTVLELPFRGLVVGRLDLNPVLGGAHVRD